MPSDSQQPSAAPGSLQQPGSASRRAVELTLSLTACTFGQFDAQERLAAQLRLIADKVEEGETVMESGSFCHADWGKWEISTPFEPNI